MDISYSVRLSSGNDIARPYKKGLVGNRRVLNDCAGRVRETVDVLYTIYPQEEGIMSNPLNTEYVDAALKDYLERNKLPAEIEPSQKQRGR